MGKFSERNATTVSAYLRDWVWNKKYKTVFARIWFDIRVPAQEDGASVIIRNYESITYFPPSQTHIQEHYLLKTNTGDYFVMNISDKKS